MKFHINIRIIFHSNLPSTYQHKVTSVSYRGIMNAPWMTSSMNQTCRKNLNYVYGADVIDVNLLHQINDVGRMPAALLVLQIIGLW